MPLYKPSELHEFLSSLGIRPKKGLSQNFLIDGNIIRKIISTAEVSENDVVLEIGPGPGSLTEALLQKKAKIIAVEKDPILAKALERFKTPDNFLEIHNQDILEFPILESLSAHLKPHQKAKVIANLPYHLTTPIIADLVKHESHISTLVLMVQDEVATRFTAKPHTEDYSSFTVFLNFFSKPTYAFQVSKNCFFPIPKVQSAIVKLDLKKPEKISNQEKFFEMTRCAFTKRRKMVRSALETLYPKSKIIEALEKLHLSPTLRPENLSLEEWIKLFEELN